MANNQVSVEITLEEKAALKALTQLTKEVQKTESSFTKMGKSGDESLGLIGNAASGVSGGFKSLVAGVTVANLASSAILGTANALKNFALGSLDAAIESEAATNKLSQALKAVGAFSTETVEDFKAYASSLAEVSIHSDDLIVEQLALAKSFGASNSQAKELVKAATELSATFGGSLESRVQQLGKTFTGVGGKLDSLVPGFKNLTEAQLKAGDGIDLINSKLGGAAASQIDSYAGKMSQLTKSVGELQESLGGFVVESGITSAFESITFAINKFTQSIADNRTEAARGQEGFKETSTSLEQLKRKYDDLRVSAIDLEQTIINPGMNMDKTAIFIAQKQLSELNAQIAKTKALIDTASPKVAEAQAAAPQGTSSVESAGISKEDQKRIDSYALANVTIADLKAQSLIADQELNAQIDSQALGRNELELQQIYEFEALKLEAQFQAEEEKANLIKDGQEKKLKLQEIGAKRELDFTKLANKQIGEEGKKRIATNKEMNDSLLSATSDFAAAGASIAKEGSIAQKALQTTQAIISTYTAANNTLATVPYPANIAAASGIVAIGLANVAKIAGAKFEYGGIVSGNKMTGDGVQARVNSGEMILNRQQQTQLFNIANGSSSGDGALISEIRALRDAIERSPTQLVVDGRVLATVIRGEVRAGFKLG